MNMIIKTIRLKAWLMILAGCSVGVISCKTETNNNESKGYSLAVINADSNKEIRHRTQLRLRENRILIFIHRFRDTLKN